MKPRSTASKLLALALLSMLLGACSGIQTDTAPIDRFKEGNYSTYSWRAPAIANSGQSNDPLYTLDPTLRSAVNNTLAGKGYRLVDEGGDFLIDYQFRATLSEGALSSSADQASERNPSADAEVVINRRANQALVDNAYALAGPRPMNNIVLQFSDAQSQSLVWAASMSKVVENLNQTDVEKMRTGIATAVRRIMLILPNAD
mgnify:CR=1 FL=1